jgi:hypothetical protein
MLRKRWLMMGLALLAAPALAYPARAQERQGVSPLAMVPDKAPMVIAIRGLQATTDRALIMVKNALPDLADKAKEALEEGKKKVLEEMLQGRGGAIKALADEGPIFLAFMEFPEPGANEPNAAVIARVKDYKAFRDGLVKADESKDAASKDGVETVTINGKMLHLVQAGNYAVLTPNQGTAKTFAQKKVTGLDKRLDEESAKRLLSADIGFYIDMGTVLEKYAEQIRQAQDQANDTLAQVENLGKTDKAQMKLVKMMLDAMFRTIQDSRTLVYTLSFEPQGLKGHIGLGLAKDSVSAKYLKDMKLSPLAGLTRLPAGYMTYTGMDLDPQMYKIMQPLTQGIFADPATDEGKKSARALEEMVKAGPRGMASAQTVPTRSISVTQYDDPGKALAAVMSLFEALAKNEQFAFMPLKEGLKVKRKAQSFRGSDWHEISMKFDLEKMFAEVPIGGDELLKAMKKITGDGTNIWIGAVDKAVITATAKDWDGARALIDQYLEKKSDLSADKSFRATRDNLPREITMVQVINMAKYLDMITDIVRPLLQAAGQDVEIPASKEKEPAYVGVSASLLPRRVGLDVFISGGSAREVYRVIDPFIKKFAGGGF